VLKSLLVICVGIILAIGVWASAANAAIFSFAGDRPSNLGFQNNQFAPCATTPNCVSSQATDEQHQIAPITATDWEKLKQTIATQPNATIIESTDNYLYAEFTSQLMGFVDDVEFAKGNSVIEVRSASRLGESDLGVNRDRIERIRQAMQTE
jgi:uncharacterized protein (DUF1499 family)